MKKVIISLFALGMILGSAYVYTPKKHAVTQVAVLCKRYPSL